MTLAHRLAALEASGLIHLAQVQPEIEYLFRHALVQEAAYASILKADRRVLHHAVGEALERLYPDRLASRGLAPLLARHFTEAGQVDKAVDYWLLAGDQARRVFATQEAIDAYQRALTLLKEDGDLERAARTLMKLGLTHHIALDFLRSRQAYEEGFALWQHVMVTASTATADVPPAPHPLRLDTLDPTTLDPAMAYVTPSIRVIQHLFSGLVEQSFDLEVVPAVARGWEISEDGLQYRFHLREDARWSDGVRVTAADFEYAWKRILAPATRSPIASGFFDIRGAKAFHQGETSDPVEVGVRALDDVTLEVILEEPAGYFLQLLATGSWPAPRHVVEAHPTDWAEPGRLVSNGPFILESWERGQRLVLTRNPAYAGRFTGNVQRAELYFDQSDMLALYEADQRDIALHIHFKWSPPEREHALQRYVGEYMLSPALWVSYLGFDVTQPPFHDARVRRALAMAADREKLVSVALHGEVFPATGGLTPPNMFGHSPGIALPYDPDRARRSLAEAGYPGGQGFPAVFTWIPTTPAFRLFREMFRYLQAQWREQLGLEITVEPMEGAEAGAYYDQLREAPPSLFLAPWLLDYPDPDNILRLGSFRSYTRWRNETYDRLLEEARRTMDADARLQKYQQADRLLVEEAAVVPLSYQWHHALVKPWVKRFFVTPTTMYFLRDVILEPH